MPGHHGYILPARQWLTYTDYIQFKLGDSWIKTCCARSFFELNQRSHGCITTKPFATYRSDSCWEDQSRYSQICNFLLSYISVKTFGIETTQLPATAHSNIKMGQFNLQVSAQILSLIFMILVGLVKADVIMMNEEGAPSIIENDDFDQDMILMPGMGSLIMNDDLVL